VSDAAELGSPGTFERFRAELVANWAERVTTEFPTLHVSHQHGDLNPRNILLTQQGAKLIDFARFGEWPVGYDLVRLELQLIFRCFETLGARDSMPSFLALGVGLSPFLVDCVADATGLPEPAMSVIKHVNEARLVVGGRHSAAALNKITTMCRCYELIKMCSYQDASVFKRLLFLIFAVRCGREAGLFRP
jgi:hypothetical protein